MTKQRMPSTLLAALVLVVASGYALGQMTNSAPPSAASDSNAKTWKFEVVSIRQSKADDVQSYGLADAGPTPNGWRMRNGTLALTILTAYTPQNGAAMYTGKQVEGQPEWSLSNRYDIDARISEADRADWDKPQLQKVMLRSMLQAMLTERCKMAAHSEIRELPAYLLVVIKDAPKFKETVPGDPHPGTPVPGGGKIVTEDSGKTMHFYDVAIGSLTPLLTNWEGKPVLDKTGLTGRYDFRLQRPSLGGPSAASDDDQRPSIPEALADLGLTLESGKGQVEIFVVDHVERPSQN